MAKTMVIAFGFLFSILCHGQKKDTIAYEYQKLDVDLKKDFNNANFILDYYFTDGSSLGDRYFYEIIVTDSIITLTFDSPDFGDYNLVKYVKQIHLQPEEVDTLKQVTLKAKLKQTHDGIAHWDGTMYTREVLIVKLDDMYIAGGQTYGSLGTYSEEESDETIQHEIEKDKEDSSSIGGDYKSIIALLKTYFTNLEAIHKSAYKY
jgi:hypothetical protein